MRPDPRFLLLLGCFLISGAAGLVYQTAWTQQFALVFGASELAVVSVLAAYMAGLTAGAAVAARWVARVRRPVLAYAVLELGVAASALAVPLALRAAGRVQAAMLGGAADLPDAGGAATLVFHVCASFAILLVPTGLMGATLPLLARQAVRSEEELGPRIGTLYTVNTLGAAGGALAGGFVLLPALGLGQTVLAGAAANAAAFLLAVPLFGERAGAPPAHAARADPPVRGAGLVLAAMVASSAVSFTYEVLWTRLLTFVLGASVYAFAAMLSTFLLGLALGAGIASKVARTRRAARIGFALAQAGTAVASLAAYHALDRLPALADRVSAAGGGALAVGASLSALSLLPGAICIGTTVPFGVRMLAGAAEDAARATARVYAWSTVGAVVGSILGGLWLLPALGFERTLLVLCAVGLGLAAACAWPPPRLPAVAAAAAAAAAGIALWPPAPPWRLLRHSTLPGTYTGEVTYLGVGRGATVMVIDLGGEWRLTSNGLPESAIQGPGTRAGRYAVAHWLSLLAVAARPEARSVMVVGLGAGKTVERLPPEVESIDVVELEPEIVHANRVLAGRRARDPLADPRVRLRLNDARSALLLTARRFDAIVSQPSHPWTAGASHLFTREFFALVHGRLTPEGVFVLWMGQQFVDERLLRSLLATLTSVFPHVEVYDPRPGGSLLFVAAARPLDMAATAGRAIAAAPAIWAELGVTSVEDVLAARVQDQAGVAKLALGSPLNTDQRNLLQARSPLILDRPLGVAGSDRVFGSFDPLRAEAAGPAGGRLVRRFLREGRLPRARRMAGAMPPGVSRRVAEAEIEIASGRRAHGEAALAALHREEPGAREPAQALLVVRADEILLGRDRDGLLGALSRDPLASAVLEGWRLARAGRLAEARPLEGVLAGARPHEPLYEAAMRLRLGWRHATGDPVIVREGIGLLDRLMAEAPSAKDALLRARMALVARDPDAVRGSLLEIAEVAGYSSEFQQVAREALKLLDAVAGGSEPSPALRQRLTQAAGAGG